ncbi:hypothetical protein GOP47_0006461 [Adiantum capillus-veneris]|uniref:F-box domain-containing protein n=1 Tax=Adiantum capillus-veneris TaxID=13818 RepID=A0A9D4ZN24_ADICA|nr:hypothetical protein GOP47_0006461 [Adiantum capillus-veneris]
MERERLSEIEAGSSAAAATSADGRYRHQMKRYGEEEAEGSGWALTLPSELVAEEVLPKLSIRDLFRLRAVHSSFNQLIAASLSTLKRQRPIDLPWFYCMIATQRRADDSG